MLGLLKVLFVLFWIVMVEWLDVGARVHIFWCGCGLCISRCAVVVLYLVEG